MGWTRKRMVAEVNMVAAKMGRMLPFSQAGERPAGVVVRLFLVMIRLLFAPIQDLHNVGITVGPNP